MDAKAWDRILAQIQVRQGKYILTIHAEEELENDNLCLDDLVNTNGDKVEIVAKIGVCRI